MVPFAWMVRRFGNAGAVANARRACVDRREAERAIAVRLKALGPTAAAPVRAA